MQSYLCISWQGLIQHIVGMISVGYYYYQEIVPKRKLNEEEWEAADARILTKFGADMNKDKRRYAKQQGKANHIYIRYNTCAILLKTMGDTPEIHASEVFHDIREKPLVITISDNIEIKIGKSQKRRKDNDKNNNKEKYTAYLTRACYRSLKAEFSEFIEHQNINRLKFRFNILNGLPCYSGIILHKVELREHIIKHAKARGIILDYDDFVVKTDRKSVPIFTTIKDKD